MITLFVKGEKVGEIKVAIQEDKPERTAKRIVVQKRSQKVEEKGDTGVQETLEKKRPLAKGAKKPLFVKREISYQLDGDPKKTIIIGELNRTLEVDEVMDHRALATECPYSEDCAEYIIKVNIDSHTCSLCLVFKKHILAKRAGKI